MKTTRLYELFVPDFVNGRLLWRVGNGSRANVGCAAGGIHKSTGYVRVAVDGKEAWVHRVIWQMSNGAIPAGLFIDHINGIRHDNRLENLRLADRTINGINRRAPASHSSSGAIGVKFRKGAYEVRMRVAGAERYIGRYKTIQEAADARERAKLTVLEELQARAA